LARNNSRCSFVIRYDTKIPITNVIVVAKNAVFIDITSGYQSIFTDMPPFLL